MTSAPREYKPAPHAALELGGRQIKASRIRSLLPVNKADGCLRLLEIGTGSGAIANYFGGLNSPTFDVDAVDVVDQRQVFAGYRFRQVAGPDFPCDDASFDIVISNHVIEHVGGRSQQERHLLEIARTLVPGGIAYLASPNRWQVVEPHFHVLAAKAARSRYLSLWARKRQVYEPLDIRTLEGFAARAGLQFQNICVQALRNILAQEPGGSSLMKLARRTSDGAIWRMRAVCPTHIYLLRRNAL